METSTWDRSAISELFAAKLHLCYSGRSAEYRCSQNQFIYCVISKATEESPPGTRVRLLLEKSSQDGCPSPAGANGSNQIRYEDPLFSVMRGFYSTSTRYSLETALHGVTQIATGGAAIRRQQVDIMKDTGADPVGSVLVYKRLGIGQFAGRV